MLPKQDRNELINPPSRRWGRAAVLIVVVMITTLCCGQQQISVDSKVSKTLARMESDDLSVRERAFEDLLQTTGARGQVQSGSHDSDVFTSFYRHHPDQANPIKLGIIRLLSRENDLFVLGKNATPEKYTEADSEYYAELIQVVSGMNDERAIPALEAVS